MTQYHNIIRQSYLMNLWRWKCGLPERTDVQDNLYDLYQSEWSNEFMEKVRKFYIPDEQFVQMMKNRLVIGTYRYGYFHDKDRPKYDHISSARKRYANYLKDGNGEHLIDIANFMMLEFVRGQVAHTTMECISGILLCQYCRITVPDMLDDYVRTKNGVYLVIVYTLVDFIFKTDKPKVISICEHDFHATECI